MRFILGLIVGAALVILGAYVHDSMDAGSLKPLVNWENAAEMQHSSVDYLRAQFDRLTRWVTSN
jgi:hypothetical protein